MSWIVAAIGIAIVGNDLYQEDKAYKKREEKREEDRAEADAQEAKDEAAADVLEQEESARKAEQFSKTEGEGIGQLGTVSLEVDEDDDESGLSI